MEFILRWKSGKCQNNTFCQIYHITTLEVVFYHPSGLTVCKVSLFPCSRLLSTFPNPSEWLFRSVLCVLVICCCQYFHKVFLMKIWFQVQRWCPLAESLTWQASDLCLAIPLRERPRFYGCWLSFEVHRVDQLKRCAWVCQGQNWGGLWVLASAELWVHDVQHATLSAHCAWNATR